LLVDRADLLDIEGAVGEPLAVEDRELLEDPVDRAVGQARDLVGEGRGTALEEGKALGIEELPPRRTKRKSPVPPPAWTSRNRTRSWAQAP